MKNRTLVLAALLLTSLGCEGIGRPVVDTRPVPEMEEVECGPRPGCRYPRVVPDERFVPPARSRLADCDFDGVVDVQDECPGIPNATAGSAPCRAARTACERLIAGEALEDGADLRGCRPDAPLEHGDPIVLRNPNLRCASLEWAAGSAVELIDPVLDGAELRFSAPIAASILGGRILSSSLYASEGSSLYIERTEITGSEIVLAPVTTEEALGAPSLELVAASVATTAVREEPGARPGLVRVEDGTFVDGWLDVRTLTVVAADVQRTSIAAEQLDVLDTELGEVAVRADSAAFAAVNLIRVTFATCGELAIGRSELVDVSLPRCEPAHAVLRGVIVADSIFAGGVQLENSDVRVSIFGGEDSSLVAFDSVLQTVSFCEQTQAAFVNGSLRCVGCGLDDFSEGEAVCLTGTEIYERGCPAIELAPECPSIPER